MGHDQGDRSNAAETAVRVVPGWLRMIAASGLVLLTSACGDGDASDGVATTAAETTTVPSVVATTSGAVDADPSTTTAAAGSETSSPSVVGEAETSVATVTIGDSTYEFRTTGFPAETCDPAFFGGAQVVLAAADDNGEPLAVDGVVSPLDLALIPPDLSDDAPSLELRTPEGVEWIADADSTVVSGSAVDDWSVDGSVITGSATFASPSGDGPMPGSFEVSCAEE